VVMPGCTLHEGSGVGALSLVRRDCEPLGMYSGVPARRIGQRSPAMLSLGDELERHGGAMTHLHHMEPLARVLQ
jgi:hypothetical protein